MIEEMFYKPSEVAKMLKVKRPTIYSWIKSGKIKAFRASVTEKGPWRIPATELKRIHAIAYES